MTVYFNQQGNQLLIVLLN